MMDNKRNIRATVFLEGNESYGLQQVLLVHYEESKSYGIDLNYVCLNRGDTYKKLVDMGADVTVLEGKMPKAYPPNIFKLLAIFLSNVKACFAVYRKLRAFLKQNKPDLLYTHNVTEHVIGGFAAKSCGVKAVGHSHLLLNPHRNFGLSRKILSAIFNCSLDMVIPVSYAARDSLWGGVKKKAYPIYVGRDIQSIAETGSRLKEAPQCPAADIICIGRLAALKKQDVLVDAVRILVSQGLPVKAFLVSGEADESNPYYVKLREQISSLGIEDNIVFTGFVARPYGMLAKAKVSVLCCEKEACPNLVMESMACRTPIVVPDAGGAGELVQNGRTGLKFVADDADSLAGCIRRLLDDNDLRERLTENASCYANETFTCNVHMDQLRKRFEQVIEE